MKVYLTGGWGYGNLGDDAILQATLHNFRRELANSDITISSFNPDETKFHHGIDCVPSMHYLLKDRPIIGLQKPTYIIRFLQLLLWKLSMDLFKKHWFLPRQLKELVQHIDNTDVVVMGGGGYFNDLWIPSYVSRMAEIIVADTLGKDIYISGQTLGPFNTTFSRLFFRRILRKVNSITYRDKQSRGTILKYSYPESKTLLTADEANTILPPQKTELRRNLGIGASQITVGIMVQMFRPYESFRGTESFARITDEAQYLNELEKTLMEIKRRYKAKLVFLPSTSWDIPTCRKLFSRIFHRFPEDVSFIEHEKISHYIRQCQSVDIMISTNMHPIILAATNAVPSLAISYFYKVDDFMASLGLTNYVSRIDQIDADVLLAQFHELLENHAAVQALLMQNMSDLRERALANVKQLKASMNAKGNVISGNACR